MSAPIRITLGVPNDSQPIKVRVESNKQRRQIDVTAPIVEETLPTYEGPYDVSPTESEQTLFTNEKKMTDDVTVGAIPSDYVGSEVPRKTSADLTASGPTVTAPAGYYAEAASKSVAVGSVSVEDETVTANPTISVSTVGRISASYHKTVTVTPSVTEGYVTGGESGSVTVSGSKTYQLLIQSAKTVTPTESEQTAVESQKYTVGEVKVAAIPADYVGSDIPQRASSDMTASGAIVTAPAGYYAAAATKSVDIGSATVNDTGITANPSISVGNDGKVTATVSKVQSIAPQVTPGYVSAGTAGDITVTGYTEQQLTTQAAQTITPTTSDQTIASGKYLTGVQTIKGDANLVPESIVENITIFGVTGNAPPPVTVVHLL